MDRYSIAATAIVIAGVLPRVAQFVHYRALFHDECALAIKLLDRTAWELFQPYGESMAAGGFMLILKAALAVLGTNEYAVRFPAFVASLMTLFLFYPIARRYISQEGALVGLAFIAVSKHLIYFGDYVRPYSSDATIAIGLLGLVLLLETEEDLGWKRPAAIALAGAVAVWLSLPSVFVLAGAGTVQIVSTAMKRDMRKLATIGAAYLVAALSFGVLYFVSLGRLATDGDTMSVMNVYYEYAGAFLPFPTSIEDVKWIRFQMFKIFDFPGGLTMTGLGMFVALTGMYSTARQSPKRFLMVLAPVGMAVIASMLHLYPFWQRTILYLAPIMFIFIGEGIAYLYRSTRSPVPVVAALCLIMLILVPGFRAARVIVRPTTHHELNKILDHALDNWQENDLLYVHKFSSRSMPYLKWRYDFPDENMIIEWERDDGNDDPEEFFAANLERMKEHGRVWVAGTADSPRHNIAYFARFDAHAARVDEFEAIGAQIVLYDFRDPPD